jgi:shikimate dehydrogenase
MDAYGLFGYPVHHSWSPFIHGLFARQTGQELTYHLFESEPAHFRHDVLDFFFNQGGCGCNVTLPHKRAAAELVNELTPRAQRADAVNTILRREDKLVGDNTDGVGLLTDLRQNLGLRFQSPRILLLGAGGAARGVLAPLLQLQPAVLLIANRTPERAVDLAREFADLGATHGASFDAAALQQPFDLIVNATSASLQGAMPPVPAKAIGARTACYDMAYGLGETAFTRWARAIGAAVVAQGWGMLVEQAAVAFELWRGVRPVTRPVLNALQEHAAAKAAARTPA